MTVVNNLPKSAQGIGIGGLTLADAQSIADALANLKSASTENAVTASTTQTQAGGTVLRAAVSRVTSANASDAVTLGFAATAGQRFTIINDSGQTIQLFPRSGDKLNDANANAAVSIADNTVSHYACPVAGLWFGGATSFET